MLIEKINKAILNFTYKMKDNFYPEIFRLVYDQNPHHSVIRWSDTGEPKIYIHNEIMMVSDGCHYSIVPPKIVTLCLDKMDDLIESRLVCINDDHYKFYFLKEALVILDYWANFTFLSVYHTKNFNVHDFISKLPCIEKDSKTTPAYSYVTVTAQGDFYSDVFELTSNYNVDLVKNYNEDLPFDSLIEFCKKNTCGLTLLYGEPGCGKTTVIKNLIGKLYSDVDFILLDASMLSNIVESKFLSYLMSNANSVVILEDCEKLLVNREEHDNPWIGTLLNLTDGMLGEALKIKFICTFNSNITSIDKALIREGRLDICYEFKKLFKEKAQVLCQERNIPCTGDMTLAQIYKTKMDNSNFDKSVRKIGF